MPDASSHVAKCCDESVYGLSVTLSSTMEKKIVDAAENYARLSSEMVVPSTAANCFQMKRIEARYSGQQFNTSTNGEVRN